MIPPVPQQRGDYDCGRCSLEVTSATAAEVAQDGWQAWAVKGPRIPAPSNTQGYTERRLFWLCGDCAGMMRTLQEIQACPTDDVRTAQPAFQVLQAAADKARRRAA